MSATRGRMAAIAGALYAVCVVVWVGGGLATGYLAAPVLFARLPDRTLAGALAGDMFAAMAWVGIVCAIYLLAYRVALSGASCRRQPLTWVIVAMLALLLIGHFGITPILAGIKAQAVAEEGRDVMSSTLRARFGMWHGISSSLFLLHSVLGLILAGSLGWRRQSENQHYSGSLPPRDGVRR